MKLIISLYLIFTFFVAFNQESLLLGELKRDEIKPDMHHNNESKAFIYSLKYKKKGNYKDSVLAGVETYSKKGELLKREVIDGKTGQAVRTTKYAYDEAGNVVFYERQQVTKGGVMGETSEFMYDRKGQLMEQSISLANIRYSYFADGKIRSKSYHYNNKGAGSSAPWVMLFVYDENGNVIHADTDTTRGKQTSFYDEKNQLVRHDYYPGVAFSTYEYNDQGWCTKQVDYQMNKRDWDSTVYIYAYDLKGRLVQTSSSKKGRITRDREWVYNSKGQLTTEITFIKNNPKKIYRYTYEYFTE